MIKRTMWAALGSAATLAWIAWAWSRDAEVWPHG